MWSTRVLRLLYASAMQAQRKCYAFLVILIWLINWKINKFDINAIAMMELICFFLFVFLLSKILDFTKIGLRWVKSSLQFPIYICFLNSVCAATLKEVYSQAKSTVICIMQFTANGDNTILFSSEFNPAWSRLDP